jgi:hypothetical protein
VPREGHRTCRESHTVIIGRICAGALALVLAAHANAACKIVQLAEWPVSHANNRPLVEGKVNGQPVMVLIDTGTNSTYVWKWTANQLPKSS